MTTVGVRLWKSQCRMAQVLVAVVGQHLAFDLLEIINKQMVLPRNTEGSYKPQH